jgi:hypothetical protein
MLRHTFLVVFLVAFTSAQKLFFTTLPPSMSPLSQFLTVITSGGIFNAVEVYCKKSEPAFESLAARWSDIDRKTPKCIILPQTEQGVADIVFTLIYTVSNVSLIHKPGEACG